MRAVGQLAWKEVRESASGAALGAFIMCGFTGVALRSRLVPDSAVLAIGMMMAAVLSVFFAMWPVAADRREGVLGTLLALPVRGGVVLAVKVVVTGAMLVVPILAAWGLFAVMAGGREVPTELLWFGVWPTLAACLLTYLWVVCLGVGQPSEARVGLLAIAVTVGLSLLFFVSSMVNSELTRWLVSCTPLSVLIVLDETWKEEDLALCVVCNAVLLVLLVTWATWRFGRFTRTKG